MDYKELIEYLHGTVRCCDGCYACDQAAAAIETLLEERDAAVECLSNSDKRCQFCVNSETSVNDYPCCHCYSTGGMTDYFEWGSKKSG